MTALPAAADEPRRTRGGAAGARPRRRGRRSEQMIDVPDRVFRGPHYSDDAVAVWTKTAALDVDGNPEHCNAGVEVMAAFAGMSKSAYERGLTETNRPGPDGHAEIRTRRMTHRGGRGRTAIRTVRPVRNDEPYVTVPVTACEALTPRLFRAYLLLARAEADQHPLTAGELAGELFHHHGAAAGRPVSERTARRVLRELGRRGWIYIAPRGGYQGRHLIAVNATPLHPVENPTAATLPPEPVDIHDGSGPDTHDGSLAIKEDRQVLTDPGAHVSSSSAVGEVREVSVDNPPAPAYDGPGLQISPRVWHVLAPVHHLLPGIRPWALRRAAREIGAQLDSYATPARLHDRIQWRFAQLDHHTSPVTDAGRWLLGAGLSRWGCADLDCESGWRWSTGERCRVCAEITAARREHPPDTDGPPPPTHATTAGPCADHRTGVRHA